MSPTPTPSPSPAPLLEDDGFSQLDHGVIPLAPGHPCLNSGSMKCILDHQQQTADELNAQSTLTPAESARFDALMADPAQHSAAPIVAGIVLSVLVLVAGAVAFIKRRRNNVTSPAAAEV